MILIIFLYWAQHVQRDAVKKGTVSKELKEIFPRRSFSLMNLNIFTSPWAVTIQEEEKFEATIEAIGRIIKDDIALGTLYSLLVLATPGDGYTHSAL